MRRVRVITVAVLALGAIVYSYFQFRPRGTPSSPPPPPEKLVELDPDSPEDRALEAYLAVVQKAGWDDQGNGGMAPFKDPPIQAADLTAWLARFDGRLPLLAADARGPILALQAYARTVQQHEKMLVEKIAAERKDEKLSAEKIRGWLLVPVVLGLTHGIMRNSPGSLTLVDATVGKPAVLRKTERDGEVLYRLRWRQEPADIYESLILVKEEGTWKVLAPWGIGCGVKSIAADPKTGQGGDNSLAREDKDWRAADFRKANLELASRLRDGQAALEEFAAGKITAEVCGKRLAFFGEQKAEAKAAKKDK